jgi:hypothetical protein
MFIPDPASAFFIPDPGSRADKIPDSGFRIRIRIKEHKVLKNKIRDVHPRYRIPDLDLFFFIPDPGSGSATLVVTLLLG